MNRQLYDSVRGRYGDYASWAVWAEQGEKAKSNMGDLSVLDPDLNPDLLDSLKPDVMLIALNISKRIEKPLSNFHGANGEVYKLRYALKGTRLWGSYMTDAIKDFEEKASGRVVEYLRRNPSFEAENVAILREEMDTLGCENALLVAIGADSFGLVSRHYGSTHRIIGLPHYGKRVGVENYRHQVKEAIRPESLPATGGAGSSV